jgi:uncharacterized membrane protein (UPF0127 family)
MLGNRTIIIILAIIVSVFSVFNQNTLLLSFGTANAERNNNNFLLNNLKAIVTVNGYNLSADLAITGGQIEKGLSVKDQLKENEGMLFVFDTSSNQSFWMKNMKFPIDIMWLDKNRTVVHVERNLQPCITVHKVDIAVFDCAVYTPYRNARYVLETVAGFSQRHNVKLGTSVHVYLRLF